MFTHIMSTFRSSHIQNEFIKTSAENADEPFTLHLKIELQNTFKT